MVIRALEHYKLPRKGNIGAAPSLAPKMKATKAAADDQHRMVCKQQWLLRKRLARARRC